MTDTPTFTFGDSAVKNLKPRTFTIAGPRGNLVVIDLDDGSVTFGEYYDPTEAAQVFWSAISAEYRDYLASKVKPEGKDGQ